MNKSKKLILMCLCLKGHCKEVAKTGFYSLPRMRIARMQEEIFKIKNNVKSYVPWDLRGYRG